MTAREREINQTKDLTRFSCAFSKNARAFFSGAAKKGDNTHTVHSGAHQCPPAIYVYKYCIYTDISLYTADKSLYLFTLVLLFLCTYFVGIILLFFLNIFSV